MNQLHDRTMGDKPWELGLRRATTESPEPEELYTKENPYHEGPAKYWTEGQYPEPVIVICVGPQGEFPVPESHWLPDPIYAQKQILSNAPA